MGDPSRRSVRRRPPAYSAALARTLTAATARPVGGRRCAPPARGGSPGRPPRAHEWRTHPLGRPRSAWAAELVGSTSNRRSTPPGGSGRTALDNRRASGTRGGRVADDTSRLDDVDAGRRTPDAAVEPLPNCETDTEFVLVRPGRAARMRSDEQRQTQDPCANCSVWRPACRRASRCR